MKSIANIDTYIATLSDKITDYDAKSAKLKEKREIIFKARALYPDIAIARGALCSPSVWDKVSCMSIKSSGRYRSDYVAVMFYVGFKHSVDGAKIFVAPVENIIARINRSYTKHSMGIASRQPDTIQILDYKSIIPDACPNKSIFIRRMKKSLIKLIQKDKLVVTQNSFDIDVWDKLSLLI